MSILFSITIITYLGIEQPIRVPPVSRPLVQPIVTAPWVVHIRVSINRSDQQNSC